MAHSANINRISPQGEFCLPEDRLLVATRAWLIWLQGLFKSRPKGYYNWDPNMQETEIVISDQNPAGIEVTNKRPLISTSRGTAAWASTSLSQKMTPSWNSPNEVWSDLVACSMTISCVAKEGLEAQDIAYTIFRMIPVFKQNIIRLGRMHAIGNNIQITPETQHGQVVSGSSTPEWKMVQLHVPFYVQDVISAEEKDFYSYMQAVNLHMGLD